MAKPIHTRSWTSDYGAWPGEHGGVRLKTEIPISSVVLHEYEAMFKGIPNLKTEVIAKQ